MHTHIWSFSVQTGGTWALQQLAAALQDDGHKVSIALPRDPIPGGADVVVAPEIAISQLCAVHGPLRVLWWLSVDNAYWRPRRDQLYDQLGPRLLGTLDKVTRHRTHDLLRQPGQTDILHAVQSEYARVHVRNVLGVEPLMLTDFLTDIPALTAPMEARQRERRVVYNPAKGLPSTLRVIRKLDGDVEFRPIGGLTHAETVQLLRDSLIYLDLGSHPGRDRVPREAALAGCIVLIGKRGAGINAVDYVLPDSHRLTVPWKFQDAESASDRIRRAIADPQYWLPPMKHAVDEILLQRDAFMGEVKRLVAELDRRLGKNA